MVSVEPTYSYYEKVSEELERIVLEVQEQEEVQPLSDGEKHVFRVTFVRKIGSFRVWKQDFIVLFFGTHVSPTLFTLLKDSAAAVLHLAHLFSWRFLSSQRSSSADSSR